MSDQFDTGHLPRPRSKNTRDVLDTVSAIRVAASDLMQRAGLAQIAGVTFGGNRDLYAALGYPRALKATDYRARYLRGDIAARIVETYPNATWRDGTELIEDEDPETVTEFEEQFDSLNKRLNVWATLLRADILAGLGRYSVLLIGAAGNLDTELPKLNGPDDVLYLSPYAEDDATIDTFEEDTANERYGLPVMYRISRGSGKRTLDKRVHWTRVIHIADGVLDEVIYGQPRLERVWNRLDDLEKVLGGGSEAFWIRVHQGTLLNVDPNIKIDPAEIDKLKDEASEFINGMKRFLTLRGVELETLGGDVSNFNPQVASLVSIISASTGIPQRLLLGSERGELSSTQDKEAWDDRVADRRHAFAEPLVRDFVDRLIEHGGLVMPLEYNVRWPQVEEMNEEQKANVADKLAGINKKAGGPVIMPDEIRDRVLRLPKLTAAQLREYEEKKEEAREMLPNPNPQNPQQQGINPGQDENSNVKVEPDEE